MSKNSPNPDNSKDPFYKPDYSRIDGPLLLACESVEPTESALSVFIHLTEPLTEELHQKLSSLGIETSVQPTRIVTATLNPEQVSRLSKEPIVKAIKLSQVRKPLPDK